MGRVGEWLKARVIIFCESVKIYKAFFAPYCLLFAYGMALSSPVSVIIRRILHAGGIQLFVWKFLNGLISAEVVQPKVWIL